MEKTMATSRKNHAQKRTASPHQKPIAKNSVPQQAQMPEATDAPLVNSPYDVFGPILELVTMPWRTLFPFNPWRVVLIERSKKQTSSHKEN